MPAALACNDDFAACGIQSQVTVSVTSGQWYLIRVGGYSSNTGSGTLTISPGSGNDDCTYATSIADGAYAFNNRCASTDGPDETALCNFSGDTQVGSDMWFCYTAPCTGSAVVDLCSSTYDTKVAVYDGCTCPTVADTAIACNDDSCGLQSEVTFSVQQSGRYLIRVGGYSGAQGDAVMYVNCVECFDSSDCDDGNVCTANQCDVGFCEYVPTAGFCDDGNACTVTDYCVGGLCSGGFPRECDDFNPCTDNNCAPASGCVYPANSASCDDGDPCTRLDQCQGGACTGEPIFCLHDELAGCVAGPDITGNAACQCAFDDDGDGDVDLVDFAAYQRVHAVLCP